MEKVRPSLARSVPTCPPAKHHQEEWKLGAGMEELLLPSGEDESRSEHSSYVPGQGGKTTMWDRMKTFLLGTIKKDLKQTVRGFFKRNGLLTLSVIAVLTGCTLGFMLRGTQLSTQVPLTCPAPEPNGTEPVQFPVSSSVTC